MTFSAQYLLILLFIFGCLFCSQAQEIKISSQVDRLNELGYKARLTDPRRTITYADSALNLAKRINYGNGIGEAYRVLGIGNLYLNKSDVAIQAFLSSLSSFSETGDLLGQAKTSNNLGNLYRDANNNKALEYYRKSLNIASKLEGNDLNAARDLIAGVNLNIGNILFSKQNYEEALKSFKKGKEEFTKLNNPISLTQSIQNIGTTYYQLRNLPLAEKNLLESLKKAKENDLNNSIASISITLGNLYIDQKDYPKAEKVLRDAEIFVKNSRDLKLAQDYFYTSYVFEDGRKNYFKALQYLKHIYKNDSIANNRNLSNQLKMNEEQYKQRLTIARQKNNKILFWASSVVSALLLVVVGLLYYSNTRKIKTNKQLTILNSEILQQKEELDWINQRLEKIIDERTKDLQIKNQKLSEYSWHLSHQIRGPVATMKGLMLLEKDRLIDNEEFVVQLGKCLVDIDEKITNINEALHDVKRERLGNSAAG